MKPIRLPRFTCRFSLEGLNLERFINTMGKEDIPLLSAQRAGNRKLHCICYQADMPAVESLAQEKGWKLTDQEPLQFAAVLAFLKRRWGIPLGFVLMIAMSIVLYQFVWSVEIRGAGAYHGDIAAYLIEENMTIGIPKGRVDAQELARKLNWRYPAVAWFNVYVQDMTLVVDCVLGVPVPEMESAVPGDVIAARDGVVASVTVYAGTPAVKAGDIVRKGQVLIRGQERIADEGFTSVHAQGVVTARCWQSKTVSVTLREVKSALTGRSCEGVRLCTPWYAYPPSLNTPDYLAFDREIQITPIVGSFFPCWIEKTTFHEVSLEYALRDAKKVKEEAGAAAMQRLLDSLRGHEIVDKWIDYCMIEKNSMVATATAEWLMDIGGAAPP